MKPIPEYLWLRGDNDRSWSPTYGHWWYVRNDDIEELLAATTLLGIDRQCLVQDPAKVNGCYVQFNIVAWRWWMKTKSPEGYVQHLNRKRIKWAKIKANKRQNK